MIHWRQVWDEVEHKSKAGVRYVHYRSRYEQVGPTSERFKPIKRKVKTKEGKIEWKTVGWKPRTVKYGKFL